ncbi:protein phosphatase regulator [Coemansia asiatica]|uniref:Protein phosphatase regulator n=1 Tax=Coemansia asiatica TaxID=1052880 RepID=A0A9W8CLU6_9FUNG|nr:protein phosphatase regulator [Coemansia asiatica]
MNFQGLEFDGVPTDTDIVNDDNESISSLVDEDVDFNYVYAMFHFPQMVEGQVTVDEGEKLTLLDDSNSYWWLVQNLRDNQMGYIPADNIETAFGKLARVNRRKNLKLCKPDPEHIVSSRIPTIANNNGRRVKFNDKIVTDVFITDPATDDDDDEEDEDIDYGYGYDDEDVGVDQELEDEDEDEDQRVARARNMHIDSHNDVNGRGSFDDGDNGNYDYYYSSNAGNSVGYHKREASEDSRISVDENSDPVQASSAASLSSGRRVSVAPANMGHISGEHLDDSDLEFENDSDHDSENRRPSQANRIHSSFGHSDHGHHPEEMDDSVVPASHAGVDLDIRPSSIADSTSSDRRDSSMLPHVVTDLSDYYLPNAGSDEGDSLSGVLDGLKGKRESVNSIELSVRVIHIDAFSSADSVISVFSDEEFGDMLHRSLSVFNLTMAMGERLVIYARLQRTELMPLSLDTGVAEFFDELRKQYGDHLVDSGNVDPFICTIVLADKATPHAQLLIDPSSSSSSKDDVEEDPYMSMDAESHDMLRTSLSAPITDGASPSLPSISHPADVVLSDSAVSTTTGITASTASTEAAAKRASKLRALSASFSARERSYSESSDDPSAANPKLNSKKGNNSIAGSAETGAADTEAAQDNDENSSGTTELPDSRRVVQGLLRSIQPPKSHPTQTAINRAKRNTLQITARGSVVDSNEYQVSGSQTQAHSALTRSASTRVYAGASRELQQQQQQPTAPAPSIAVNTANTSNAASSVTNDMLVHTTPSEPAINHLSQALGQSASTLRPSSDTFAGDDSNLSPHGDDDNQEGSETAEADEIPPTSPTSTSTSDTASYCHDDNDERNSVVLSNGTVTAVTTASAAVADAVADAAAAATAAAATGIGSMGIASALSSSVAHRSLKDSGSARNSILSRASVVSNASILNGDRMSIVSLTSDELSLDDWLVILHGWNDMHDISANTSSFYQAFLKDMQAQGITSPVQQTAASAAAQTETYEYIQHHVAELQLASNDTQIAIDDILGVSQGVGRRLDTLEHELDDIARVLVHAN